MPTDFIIGVTYILATILILGALNQLLNLFRARQYSFIPVVFWLFPLITLGVGILVLCKPMAAATLPLRIIGWCLMFYGVIEAVNALKIHAMKSSLRRPAPWRHRCRKRAKTQNSNRCYMYITVSSMNFQIFLSPCKDAVLLSLF